MEKFARQAIVDGVNDVKEISVTRDSEVFRALNMHYNKANDFQVCLLRKSMHLKLMAVSISYNTNLMSVTQL